MKKTNNRYRNNSSNTIYSLNYKFDSNSIAGKISGTALDLIKRYNDLAKDALSDNDHVTAEIFRQYAEHYRKIVTEINERKNMREQQAEANDNSSATVPVSSPDESSAQPENKSTVTETHSELAEKAAAPKPIKKAFHVIEINNNTDSTDTDTKNESKPRRTYRRKTVAEA